MSLIMALTGEAPTKEEFAKWSVMNDGQLRDELKKTVITSTDGNLREAGSFVLTQMKHTSKLEKTLSDLETSKRDTLFWSILLQIAGLAIAHFAALLKG